MRIIVAATPGVAVPTLNWLLNSEHVLAAVITQPDRPAGRGRELKGSVVSQWAHENSIECFKPQDLAETALLVRDCDVLLTIGYGVLLPTEILTLPRHGCLNLHFSLLPRWRGAAPVQRAIEAGDSLTGVTVFQLDEGMDTGPIFSTKRFALDTDITSDELLIELAELGVEAVMESLQGITDGKRPTLQSGEGATKASKITKQECEIDWNLSAQVISQKVRAFTSNPGAWTRFRGDTLKIDSVSLEDSSLKPGTLHIVDKKLIVGTGSNALAIGFLTPSGKSRMDALSWINGARITDGEYFG
ncbi:methionyl-tRNA formyltransferase [Candidatus Planktophila dulcis]|uniref:methionyl-tRNA formyltransferase n=1 Tax=Candidatus Planktophila dulcis TaxID=1884914 RepID=UPI003CF85174